jgi:hypothetical protein
MPSCEVNPQACEPSSTCIPERVDVQFAVNEPQYGQYEIEVTADGGPFACTIELGCPDGGGGSGATTDSSIDGGAGGRVNVTAGAAGVSDPGGGASGSPAISLCPATEATTAGSCRDSPMSAHVDLVAGRGGITLLWAPETMDATVSRDGQVVASGSFQLEYEDVGNDCESCLHSEVTLTPAD